MSIVPPACSVTMKAYSMAWAWSVGLWRVSSIYLPSLAPSAARTIALIAVLIGSGSVGQATATAAKSGAQLLEL
jgi:hypothetical protein